MRLVPSVLLGSAFAVGAVAACHETSSPSVPPVTTSSPVTAPAPAATSELAPEPSAPVDAGAATGTAVGAERLPTVTFLDGTKKLEPPVCSRLFIVVANGTAKVAGETLGAKDTLVIAHPDPVEVKVNGLAVGIVKEIDCAVLSKPVATKTVVRAKDTPQLTWAHGAMHAWLDVGARVSPELYLGRLEGTAAVPEHDHPDSTEIVVTLEASGTSVIGGKERHLGPREVVVHPKKVKHAYRPDPGTKLVSIQMYDPPGPEQRFIGLAAAEKDGGAGDGGKR